MPVKAFPLVLRSLRHYFVTMLPDNRFCILRRQPLSRPSMISTFRRTFHLTRWKLADWSLSI